MISGSRLFAITLAITLCVACESKPPTTPAMKAASDLGAATSDAAQSAAPKLAPLIQGEGVFLTVNDFERAANRAMLFAPDEVLKRGDTKVPLARLQRPFLQANVTRKLIEDVLVEKEARARGIEVTLEEVERLIAEHEKLRRFSMSSKAAEYAIEGVSLQDFGLTIADLHDVARKQLLRDKLSKTLLAEITREEVEQAWLASENRAEVMFVRVTNTPTSEEIDAFLANEAQLAQIDAYFASNQSRFLTPAIVEVDMLRAAKPGSLQELKAAAELLAKQALSPADIAEQHGLILETGQRLVRKEDPRAFGAKPGEVGISMQAPRGDYVWIVREKVAASVPKLDRPLRREIASILMREQNAVPSAKARAEEIVATLEKLPVAKRASLTQQALEELLVRGQDAREARRVKVLRPEALQRDPSGFVRGVGTSPELQEAIFAQDERGALISPAVPVDQYLWTGVLLERTRPDPEVFVASYARFLEQYREAIAPKILEMRFMQWQQRDGLKANMDVLRDHFGVYEKGK